MIALGVIVLLILIALSDIVILAAMVAAKRHDALDKMRGEFSTDNIGLSVENRDCIDIQ